LVRPLSEWHHGDDKTEVGPMSDRFCPDPDKPGLWAHYEVPRETYHKLQDLTLLMDENQTTRSFAATLQSLIGQIICALDD
jgi:hypothetical protein